MASCAHVEWLQLCQDQKELSIVYGARLRKLVEGMTRARTQYPSLLFFVGKKTKTRALRALFPENNHTRRRGHGIANLHIDSITADTEKPILFADADLEGGLVEQSGILCHCHEITRYRIDWADERDPTKDIMNKLYARLFFAFTDVLCLFAEDCGGLDGVTERLRSWVNIGPGSSMIRPRVVIVTTQEPKPDYGCFAELLPDLSRSFSAVKVVNLLDIADVSSTARHIPLKDALLREADVARRARINDRTLFSAIHLRAFFDRALRQTAATVSDPFDFVHASRERNEVDSRFSLHLSAFLRLCLDDEISLDSIASFVASATLMDAFPPGMHRKPPDPRTVRKLTSLRL